MDDEFDKDAFLKRYGAHIRKVRRSRGYSQDRLALEAGLGSGTLSKIEAGIVDPQVSTIVKIADTLGVPLSKLFEFRR